MCHELCQSMQRDAFSAPRALGMRCNEKQNKTKMLENNTISVKAFFLLQLCSVHISGQPNNLFIFETALYFQFLGWW